MGTYRATVNIAGFKAGETKSVPESPRIAALVREGFLTSLDRPLVSRAAYKAVPVKSANKKVVPVETLDDAELEQLVKDEAEI